MSDRHAEFGRVVAAHLGSGPNVGALARQRLLIGERMSRRFRGRGSWFASIGPVRAGVVCLVGGCLLIGALAFRGALSRTLGATGGVFDSWSALSARLFAPVSSSWGRDAPVAKLTSGEILPEGSILEAAGKTEIRVGFSEGSEFVLGADSRVQLERLQGSEVSAALSEGKLRCTVTPETGRRWTVHAGPYSVHVVGTIFEVNWTPSVDELHVSVLRGKVLVSGGDLEGAHAVGAGMSLIADQRDRTFRLVRHDETLAAALDGEAAKTVFEPAGNESSRSSSVPGSEEAPAMRVAPVAGAVAAEPGSASRATEVLPIVEPTADEGQQELSPRAFGESPPRSVPGGRGGSNSATWRELLQSSDYAGAVAAARAKGFAQLCETVSAQELRELGDAARLTGEGEFAERAYLALRRRFPRSQEAALAAYSLGRLEIDVRRSDLRGVKWFTTYLNEAPKRGQLPAGARAWLMEAFLRLGQQAQAAGVAQEYLLYHPLGRHGDVARKLVQSDPR